MIINSSSVAMSSSRKYQSYYESKSVTIQESAGQTVSLDVSNESKSLTEQLNEYQDSKLLEQKTRQQTNMQNSLKQLSFSNSQVSNHDGGGIKTLEDLQFELLRRIVEAMKNMKFGKRGIGNKGASLKEQFNTLSLPANYTKISLSSGESELESMASVAQAGATAASIKFAGNAMTRTTVTSSFFEETEHTAFESQGTVTTADGRTLTFGVTVEMSRGFCENNESFTQQTYLCTDPLVFNLDSNVASVSDMKFLFDINGDGTQEEISFTEEGSGFLALDKNNDGTINDGSELFGTRSGDGFADLAAYDEDGNGWIDEGDSVFADLKIWTKDEAGNDKLIDLKSADVGAIYLGSADTQFSLNNQTTNETNAIIRQTGIYLKENGGTGTVQHLDLTV